MVFLLHRGIGAFIVWQDASRLMVCLILGVGGRGGGGEQWASKLRANAQKKRAKSANRGHSSKANLPSFSVFNKALICL